MKHFVFDYQCGFGSATGFVIQLLTILLFISMRDSIDYKNPTPEQMRERILKNIKNGSIMLFHSGAKNTPAALPLVIEAVQAKGYSFVPVSQLIHPRPYAVNHEGRQFAVRPPE